MIDGGKLAGDVEADYAEVDQAELKMRKLVDMWGHMKIGDHTDLSVALVCPICPDQVLQIIKRCCSIGSVWRMFSSPFPLNQSNIWNHS